VMQRPVPQQMGGGLQKESQTSTNNSTENAEEAPWPHKKKYKLCKKKFLNSLDWAFWANVCFCIGAIGWIVAPLYCWYIGDTYSFVCGFLNVLSALCYLINGPCYVFDWWAGKHQRREGIRRHKQIRVKAQMNEPADSGLPCDQYRYKLGETWEM